MNHQIFQAAFELSRDAIIVSDESGFVECNPAALRMFGCTTRDKHGAKFPADFSPLTQPCGGDSRSLADEHVATTLKNGCNLFEWTYRGLDGSTFLAEVLATTLEADGKVMVLYVVRDLTERKRVGIYGDDSTAPAIIKSSYDAIMTSTIFNPILTFWNAGAERIFGYTEEEAVGQPMSIIVPKERENELTLNAEKLMRGETIQDFETLRKRKNGEIFPISITVSPIKDGAGSLMGASVIARDITARKLLEDKLRESEALLREAQHIAGIGNWWWDFATDTCRWSKENYLIFGRDPGLPPPKDFHEVQNYFTPKSWAQLSSAVQECRAKGKSFGCDVEIVQPNGTNLWGTFRGNAKLDSDGKIIGIHGTLQDVTERKMAEDAIKRNKDLLQSILDNTSAAIYLKDLNGRFIIVNSRSAAIFQFTAEQIIGKTDYDLFPKEEADRLRENDRKLLEMGTPVEFEETLAHPDGTTHTYISLKFPLFDSKGSPYATGGISTDISDRKLHEKLLEEYDTILQREVKERTLELEKALLKVNG